MCNWRWVCLWIETTIWTLEPILVVSTLCDTLEVLDNVGIHSYSLWLSPGLDWPPWWPFSGSAPEQVKLWLEPGRRCDPAAATTCEEMQRRTLLTSLQLEAELLLLISKVTGSGSHQSHTYSTNDSCKWSRTCSSREKCLVKIPFILEQFDIIYTFLL